MTYFDALLSEADPRTQAIARALAASPTATPATSAHDIAIGYLEQAPVRARIERSASTDHRWWHKETL